MKDIRVLRKITHAFKEMWVCVCVFSMTSSPPWRIVLRVKRLSCSGRHTAWIPRYPDSCSTFWEWDLCIQSWVTAANTVRLKISVSLGKIVEESQGRLLLGYCTRSKNMTCKLIPRAGYRRYAASIYSGTGVQQQQRQRRRRRRRQRKIRHTWKEQFTHQKFEKRKRDVQKYSTFFCKSKYQ